MITKNLIAAVAHALEWRDAQVVGPFNAEQLVLVALVTVILAILGAPAVLRRVRAWRAVRATAAASPASSGVAEAA